MKTEAAEKFDSVDVKDIQQMNIGDFLKEMVRGLKVDLESGGSSTLLLERELATQVLPDEAGRIWTVGFHTLRWWEPR